jgi:hypothetical protein
VRPERDADRHEWDHIDHAESRMYAPVSTKVKLGNRLRTEALCRFQHIVTREREDRPVMVRVRMEIEEGASYHLREARK